MKILSCLFASNGQDDYIAEKRSEWRRITGRTVVLAGTEVKYARNTDYVFRKIVDEMILVPIVQDTADMDCVYALNEIGSAVWGQLEQPRSQMDLKQAILQEYDAEPAVIELDLDTFLQEMIEIGAIQEVK